MSYNGNILVKKTWLPEELLSQVDVWLPRPPTSLLTNKLICSLMQSDGNSWKIDTFRGDITSELLI